MQLDFGADIVASLDYPIPPNLQRDQAIHRTSMTISNCVMLMKALYVDGQVDPVGRRPFPILAVHGQTPADIENCVRELLAALTREGLARQPFGIGIGSLVPLRVNSGSDKIVMLVQAVVDALRRADELGPFNRDNIPVHAFGVTGDMIPVLAHLGVDTFDSSSYVRSASALDYYDSATWSPVSFKSLNRLTCDCAACRDITVDELRLMMNLRAGPFTIDIKSDVYGIIAYHNLLLQDEAISAVRKAIATGTSAAQVVSFSKAHTRAENLVRFVADVDPSVAAALGHVQVELFPRTHSEIVEHYNNAVSLLNDPAAFDLSTRDYAVPAGKDRLLLLACSQLKPYRRSRSHSTVMRFLRTHVGEEVEQCHKVTISGLYGPVPLEMEDLSEVRGYDYVLSTSARRQRDLVVDRLVTYLTSYGHAYERVVAYVTATAYREVVERAFDRMRARSRDGQPVPQLILVPSKPHGTGVMDLLSQRNLRELLSALYPPAMSSHLQLSIAAEPLLPLAGEP
jgi:tRNA-guanine family transglycosylase